ncbi:MAG: polysaccharide deacetylase family protein, partial [Candidatus Pelagibacter ubique]
MQTVVYATEKQYHHNEQGILSLMYHRFDENKYPSTNIKMDVFKKQIEIIKRNNFEFFDPKNFSEEFNKVKTDKKILITIDDAFLSFYENAWPFLKENQIPFILFTSTDFIGKKGYMNIDQLREVEKVSFAYLGNHSHMHEYMVTFDFNKFTNDIDRSIEIFNNLFNYNPIFFSYPFGEYSLEQKNYISSKFEYAFGQHSGVIDLNKDPYELPRFPINEKYGDLKRFEFLIKLLPLQY